MLSPFCPQQPYHRAMADVSPDAAMLQLLEPVTRATLKLPAAEYESERESSQARTREAFQPACCALFARKKSKRKKV
jgi:hypothetical protein